MAYHHRVTLGPAVLEYQLGGILRIAQWQGDVVYLLLVVDDDGVGAVCCHGERVERVVLHILGFGVLLYKECNSPWGVPSWSNLPPPSRR